MTRALHWISSVDPRHDRDLDELRSKMATFYRTHRSYYSDIDFATAGWAHDPINQDMVRHMRNRSRILEIGCGAPRLLDAVLRANP